MFLFKKIFPKLLFIILSLIIINPTYGQDNIKAKDVDKFVRGLVPEVWEKRTVDGYKIGDPETEITGIAVTWMATFEVIEKAIENKCNLIVTHEPTFFNHRDEIEEFKDDPAYIKKRKLLEAHNIVVYRIHDSWDLYPEYGIQDSFAKQLGLSKIAAKFSQNRPEITGLNSIFEIEPTTFNDFIRIVKQKMGHPSLRAVGDLNKKIRKIGLGFGGWGSSFNVFQDCMRMGADVYVAGEMTEWSILRYAEDAGMCVIVVGHTRSETAGMQNCANFLSMHFPNVKIIFLDAGDPYKYF